VLFVRADQGFRYEAGAHSSAIPWSYTYGWGIYENLMPHPLYLATHFLEDPGEPKVVGFSVGRVVEAAVEEIHAIIPSRGVLAKVVLSLNGSPEANQVEVVGTRGRVLVDFYAMRLIVRRSSELPEAVSRFTSGSTFRNAFGILTKRIKRYPGIRNLIRARASLGAVASNA